MEPNKMSSFAESVKELWDKCSIQGLIILSLSLQCFLILFAPLRKRTGGKWVWFVTIPLWIAYLLADLVAIFTIGLILRAQRSGMLALWSSFLLLHLGGPDTITSFSIEDNELWIRHLLGLLSRVGSSVYIILLSLSNDMLWLPTLLVLIAGIIKYAERNRAFYLASFDHIGNKWKEANEYLPPVPEQFSKIVTSWKPEKSTPNPKRGPVNTAEDFVEAVGSVLPTEYKLLNLSNLGQRLLNLGQCLLNLVQRLLNLGQRRREGKHQKGKHRSEETTEDQKPLSIEAAVYLLGVVKNLFVGPPLSSFEKSLLPKDAHGMLQAVEINLSLLYELLHTKFPVVDSKIGYVCRIVNLVCILGALVSFSLLKKHHHKLLMFDIWLTYVLLIGALVLDLISIMLLVSSDWITMAHFQKKWKSDKFIKKRRWSNSVPQLNIFTTCDILNKDGGLANSSDFLGLRSLIRKIRRIQWLEFERFGKEQEWQFIFTALQEQKHNAPARPNFNDLRLLLKTYIHTVTKKFSDIYKFVSYSLEEFEHMDSLLIWHIVTECCYQKKVGLHQKNEKEGSGSSDSASASNNIDHRKICKKLSDYMFYLLVMEPTMIAVTPNSWKIAFEAKDKYQITSKWLNDLQNGNITSGQASERKRISRVKSTVSNLVKALESEDKRWEIMAEVWVRILCYAAVSCQPIIHARQVSKGGQLLTLVWLLMNYMELTPSGWFSSLPETCP